MTFSFTISTVVALTYGSNTLAKPCLILSKSPRLILRLVVVREGVWPLSIKSRLLLPLVQGFSLEEASLLLLFLLRPPQRPHRRIRVVPFNSRILLLLGGRPVRQGEGAKEEKKSKGGEERAGGAEEEEVEEEGILVGI